MRHRPQHVAPLHDPLRSFLLRTSFSLASSVTNLIVSSSQTLFVITPLNWAEWKAVLYLSAPVIVIDEAFKLVNNLFISPPAKVEHLKQE